MNWETQSMNKPLQRKPARAEGPWAPYAPDDKAPWDLRRVVHLHRRAGFAAGWDEIQRDLKDGPEKSIDRLLKGVAAPHTPKDFADTAELLADSAVASGEIARLTASG